MSDANPSSASPCSTPEARQFDFWLGEWDVSWGDGQHSTNRVEATLGGCVIQENFDGRPADPYADDLLQHYG